MTSSLTGDGVFFCIDRENKRCKAWFEIKAELVNIVSNWYGGSLNGNYILY